MGGQLIFTAPEGSIARPSGAVFEDMFDGATPAAFWIRTDPSGYFSVQNGRLDILGSKGVWNDPALWAGPIPRNVLGLFAGLIRTYVGSVLGPGIFLNAAPTSSAPSVNGVGILFNGPAFPKEFRRGTDTGVRLHKPGTLVRSIDYLLVLVPRATGGMFYFIGGGQFSTLPLVRLVWIDDEPNGLIDPVYAGFAVNSVSIGGLPEVGQAEFLKALYRTGLSPQLRYRYGIALGADDFDGADGSIAGRVTPTGGKAWSIVAGTAALSGNRLSLSAGGQVVFDAGAVSQIIEMDITTPAAGAIDMRLVFRRSSGARGYFRVTNTQYELVVNGVTLRSSGAFFLANNTTYKIRVDDWGDVIRGWAYTNDNAPVEFTNNNPGSSTALNTNTEVGIERGATDAGTLVNAFATWGRYFAMPSEIAPVVTPPVGTGVATFGPDSFTAADGTLLTVYNAAYQVAGSFTTFEINTNEARLTAADADGLASVAGPGGMDMMAEARIKMPNPFSVYPLDAFAGVMVRCTADGLNFISARFLYQSNSPEIEVHEFINNAGQILNAVNLGQNFLVAGAQYDIRLAVKGAEVAVYMKPAASAWSANPADDLYVQATTTLLTGTRAGFGVRAAGSARGRPTWDLFRVEAVA